MKSVKPLGKPSYGSIGHLPSSRMGPGDHHITEGEARIATVKIRDRHDLVIVQEKLDGSNVGVAKINGEIVPLMRAGYRAIESHYEQHRHFHNWALQHAARFDELLAEGERACGEWLMQAHGTRYDLKGYGFEPLVVFDLMRGNERAVWSEVFTRCLKLDFMTPHEVHEGGAISVEDAMAQLGTYGGHGALDPVEGAVWRVERKGEVNFLAKYVRPDKQDGKYLEAVSGRPPVWNWVPEWMAQPQAEIPIADCIKGER